MTPTKEQVINCLKELHSEFGLDVCFDTKTIAERLNCDPAVLYTDMDSGPLFDLLSEGRVAGDYASDKTSDYTGKDWQLMGGKIEWD